MKDSRPVLVIGFLDTLTIAFIVLKLCRVIDWPWWAVLAPMWIPVVIVAVIGVVIMIFWRERR